jgi:hypothetical protein
MQIHHMSGLTFVGTGEASIREYNRQYLDKKTKRIDRISSLLCFLYNHLVFVGVFAVASTV